MFTWIIAILVVSILGVGIGGLFITKKVVPSQILFFSVAILFGLASYLGMVSGSFIGHFLSARFAEIVIGVGCLGFVVLCLTRFHPTLGFFHGDDKGLWGMMLLLFFLVGTEWALVEMSRFFVIIASLIFLLVMIGGAILQMQIVANLWRMSIIVYFPLAWLLFFAIIKLL